MMTTRNMVCEFVGDICGLIFTVEAGVKIVAMGFVFGRNAFLTEYDNVIDFIVVIAFVIEIFF